MSERDSLDVSDWKTVWQTVYHCLIKYWLKSIQKSKPDSLKHLKKYHVIALRNLEWKENLQSGRSLTTPAIGRGQKLVKIADG